MQSGDGVAGNVLMSPIYVHEISPFTLMYACGDHVLRVYTCGQ